MYFMYAPVLIFSIILFFTLNLLLLPVGFLVSIFFKFNNMIFDVGVNKFEQMKNIVFFLIFGPVMLSLSLFTDLYFFVKHLLIKKIPKLSHFSKQVISIDGFVKLHEHTQKALKRAKDEEWPNMMAPMVDFVDELRTELEIDRKIYNIIFGNIRKNSKVIV